MPSLNIQELNIVVCAHYVTICFMNEHSLENAAHPIDLPMAESPRVELDIVRDCSDLAGDFPNNVELKFVYWTHGKFSDWKSQEEKATRLAPYCLQADRIAIEIASTAHVDSRDVHHELRIINDIVAGKNKHKTVEQSYDGLMQTQVLGFCMQMTLAMHKLGRTKPPKFLAVDLLDNPDARALRHSKTIGAGLVDKAIIDSADLRHR
jgi:azurin